jgi:hypothetical protein
MRRILREVSPGLYVPPWAPAPYRRKAQRQVQGFRRGQRNYTRLQDWGHGYLKINIGCFWRLLSRDQGATWEMMSHERYNREMRKA